MAILKIIRTVLRFILFCGEDMEITSPKKEEVCKFANKRMRKTASLVLGRYDQNEASISILKKVFQNRHVFYKYNMNASYVTVFICLISFFFVQQQVLFS